MLESGNSCAGAHELCWINWATENPNPVRAVFEKCISVIDKVR